MSGQTVQAKAAERCDTTGEIVRLSDPNRAVGDAPGTGSTVADGGSKEVTAQTEKKELFRPETPACLLLGDVDAIKSYVYETNVLPEIRGASQILQEVEENIREDFRRKLTEECLIYCGGGGFLAIVPAGEAQEWKKDIEALYLKRTHTATITIVASDPIRYEELERGIAPHYQERVKSLSGKNVAGDLLFSHFEALLHDRMKRKNFGELVSLLVGRLQQAKRSKTLAPFFETLPVHQRCQSCGKRAAAHHDQTRDEWLCSICWQKRCKGRDERRAFVEEFIAWARHNKSVDVPWKRADDGNRFAVDLETLAGSEGRIALLYADGNNMGDLLQLMPSACSYRHFSQTLASATKESLFEAIWRVFGQACLCNSEATLPFEIIALGGDDLVVVVPAPFGWALAVQVLEEFEKHPMITQLRRELNLGVALNHPVHLSLSAGLAISDFKYPVRFLFDLVEGLLKESKRLARETHTGALCHLWLRAPIISENAKALLDDLYKRDDRLLTARPYTKEQALKLGTLARELSGLAQSQQRTLAESVEKGVFSSLNYALYQAARLGEQWARLNRTFESLGELVASASARRCDKRGFWSKEDGDIRWKTALLDALELVELGAEKHFPEGS